MIPHEKVEALLEEYGVEIDEQHAKVNSKIANLVKHEDTPSFRRLELCKSAKVLILRKMQIWQYLYGDPHERAKQLKEIT